MSGKYATYMSKDEFTLFKKENHLTFRLVISEKVSKSSMFLISDRTSEYKGKPLDVVKIIGDQVAVVTINYSIGKREYVKFYAEGSPLFLHQERIRAFEGEPPSDRPLIMHLDGNKLNNDLSNLQYGSHEENMQQLRNSNSLKGANCVNAKSTDEGVICDYIFLVFFSANKKSAKALGMSLSKAKLILKREVYQNVLTDEVETKAYNMKKTLCPNWHPKLD